MKKRRVLRPLLILAVTTAMIAATAVVASAATINKNDADYKYSKTYDNGVKISFTTDVFKKKAVDDSVYCRIELPDGVSYKKFSVTNETIDSGKAFVDYSHLRDRYPGEIEQKWATVGNVSYGMIGLTSPRGGLYTGTFKLKVFVETPDKDEMIEVAFVSDFASRPVEMKITTYPDKFNINSINVSAADSGRTSRLEVVGIDKNFATITNGWNDGKCIKAKGMKPGKKYTFKFYGKLKVDNPALEEPNGIILEGNPAVFKNVEMGPAVKPVIKSVKISNVKVTKYFNYSEWRYKYKTKFTVTVTLSKKPKGAKGIQLTTTTQGISSYKTIKGTKNTYTANFNWDAPISLKGRTASFKVKTYNNTKYKAYSYDSKAKKAKI